MICYSDLNDLSREELYSVISQLDSVTNELKTEIKCLKTDLIKSKLLSDCYQKYFHIFCEINETIDLNKEVLDLLAKIKSLNNENQCFVSLKRLESQISLNQILSNEPKTSDLRSDTINPSESDVENNSQQTNNCDDTNPLRNVEVSDYRSTDQPMVEQTIVETSEEANDHKSKTIIRHKKSRGRPKGWKIKPKPRLHCLWSGCHQWFTDRRGLNLHTLRKHKLRRKQQMMIRTDPIEEAQDSENINTEAFGNSQQTDTFVDTHTVSDYESKGPKNKSKKMFKCLSNGCQKEFFGIRGLSLHLREHKLKNDPKIILKGRTKVNAISNTFTSFVPISGSVISNTFTNVVPISGSNASEKSNQSTNPIEDKNQKSNKNYIKSKESDTEVNNSDNYTAEEVNNTTDQTLKERTTVETCVKTNNHKSKKTSGFKKLGRPKSCKNKGNLKFDCLRSGCQQWFTNKRGLTLHNLREHGFKSNQKNFTTDEPMEEQSVPETSAQNNHEEEFIKSSDKRIVEIGENSENTFICDFEGCRFQTVNSFTLNEHKIKHSKEHPFGCVFCGKRSKTIIIARDHLLSVHPDKCPEFPYIECPENWCEYKTKLSSYMYKHERSHTLPVVCEYCQMGFVNKRDLREHLSTHTSARDYVCPNCLKSYKTHSQLSRHKKVHNKTLFVCQIKGCKKSFVLQSRLRLHIKHHNHS